ncbi:exported hypothetical protein [Rhodospirillaceae bacterium LM-1]|nr:exported hypothetical protein [Rhodospirillaceae bacterium LM-1]
MKMLRRRYLFFALIGAVLGMSFAAGAQSGAALDRLLERSLAAYGGQARLSSLSSLRLLGRINAKGQASQGRVERLFQAPDRLSNVISYGGSASERRVLIRDKAWRNGQTASVPEHLAMSLQMARQRLPLLLLENRVGLTDLGEREQNGRRYHAVVLTVAEGVTLTVMIDSASGLILQTAGKLALADGTNTDFTTLYSDYRSVGGLTIAMREDHYSQGIQSGTTVLEQAEINQPLPSNAFKP